MQEIHEDFLNSVSQPKSQGKLKLLPLSKCFDSFLLTFPYHLLFVYASLSAVLIYNHSFNNFIMLKQHCSEWHVFGQKTDGFGVI